MQRLEVIWNSLRSLPLWVQIWVAGILVPVNMLPFFFLETRAGVAGSLAALFVVATNVPLMWRYGGMNKVLSIPHLFAWVPLTLYLVLLLADDSYRSGMSGGETIMVSLLLAINGISLMFDVVDAIKWIKGDRATPGPSNQ